MHSRIGLAPLDTKASKEGLGVDSLWSCSAEQDLFCRDNGGHCRQQAECKPTICPGSTESEGILNIPRVFFSLHSVLVGQHLKYCVQFKKDISIIAGSADIHVYQAGQAAQNVFREVEKPGFVTPGKANAWGIYLLSSIT